MLDDLLIFVVDLFLSNIVVVLIIFNSLWLDFNVLASDLEDGLGDLILSWNILLLR